LRAFAFLAALASAGAAAQEIVTVAPRAGVSQPFGTVDAIAAWMLKKPFSKEIE
jgi:hypothetical protein